MLSTDYPARSLPSSPIVPAFATAIAAVVTTAFILFGATSTAYAEGIPSASGLYGGDAAVTAAAWEDDSLNVNSSESTTSIFGLGIAATIDELEQFAIAENESVVEAQTAYIEDGFVNAPDAASANSNVIAATIIQDAIVEAEDTAAAAEASATTQEDISTAATQVTTVAAPATAPRTINVNGDVMGYIDTYKAPTAPSTGAGLWLGSDSTTDGSWGYFIGHNPGPFHEVMNLVAGDPITVTDSNGASRTYHVVSTFTVPDSTYWEDIESQVTGYGESVIVQTCCGDNAHYRIVIAD